MPAREGECAPLERARQGREELGDVRVRNQR